MIYASVQSRGGGGTLIFSYIRRLVFFLGEGGSKF